MYCHQDGKPPKIWPSILSNKASLTHEFGNTSFDVVSMTVQYHLNDDGTYTQMGPAVFAEEVRTGVVNLYQSTVDQCVVKGEGNQHGVDVDKVTVMKLRRAFHFAQWYVGGMSSTLGPSPVEQKH
eukprot:PhF_6_TR40249/c1_g2_i3/m.59914